MVKVQWRKYTFLQTVKCLLEKGLAILPELIFILSSEKNEKEKEPNAEVGRRAMLAGSQLAAIPGSDHRAVGTSHSGHRGANTSLQVFQHMYVWANL